MRALFSALVIAATFTLTACGGASSNASGAATAGASDLKPMGEAKVGDKTLCPVSGEDFVVEASSPKVELDGKTYYFCCPGCAKKFQADPQKYLKKPAS